MPELNDAELYETMSDQQLQSNLVSLQNDRNKIMTDINDRQGSLSKVNSKIEKIMKVIGERNYADMVEHFELNAAHVALLKKYGAEVAEITASDLEIAETLGWEVADSGLTERQEENIARLLAELRFAQSFINSRADTLVNAEGPKQ